MGMDLKPVNPSADAPRYPNDYPYEPRRGQAKWGRYSWSGWSWLIENLERWGVNVAEFRGCNDGEVISEATCKAVADAIEKNIHEFPQSDREWLLEDVILWRTCGGYEQH